MYLGFSVHIRALSALDAINICQFKYFIIATLLSLLSFGPLQATQQPYYDGPQGCLRCSQFREKSRINEQRRALRKQGVPDSEIPLLPKITIKSDGTCVKCRQRGKSRIPRFP